MEMQYSVPNFLKRYQKTAPDYLASAAGFHAQLPCLEENPFYSTLKLFHTGNFDIANCWCLSDFAMKTAERIMQVLQKKSSFVKQCLDLMDEIRDIWRQSRRPFNSWLLICYSTRHGSSYWHRLPADQDSSFSVTRKKCQFRLMGVKTSEIRLSIR